LILRAERLSACPRRAAGASSGVAPPCYGAPAEPRDQSATLHFDPSELACRRPAASSGVALLLLGVVLLICWTPEPPHCRWHPLADASKPVRCRGSAPATVTG
jgi:hypothetical protein